MIALVVIGVIVVLFLIWLVGMYNSLVRIKNSCDESWSAIDTELRRRYDLIPNLVNTVKGYATHERETLQGVIAARNTAASNQGSPQAQAHDENILTGMVRQLFAVAEAYPDLQANQNFLELQRELTNTEDRIQRSRRFYNANVRDMNNSCELFPSNMIANSFGFTQREFFEIEDPIARQPVKVEF
jgi:LemA protein